jgi:hypothetical protein
LSGIRREYGFGRLLLKEGESDFQRSDRNAKALGKMFTGRSLHLETSGPIGMAKIYMGCLGLDQILGDYGFDFHFWPLYEFTSYSYFGRWTRDLFCYEMICSGEHK